MTRISQAKARVSGTLPRLQLMFIHPSYSAPVHDSFTPSAASAPPSWPLRLNPGSPLFTFHWCIRCLHVAQPTGRPISCPPSYNRRVCIFVVVGQRHVDVARSTACRCSYANEDTIDRRLARLVRVAEGCDVSIDHIARFGWFQEQYPSQCLGPVNTGETQCRAFSPLSCTS